MGKTKKYISVDVEASGPTPMKFFMPSFGAAVVGDTNVQFYRELKPINNGIIPEALAVVILGLKYSEDVRHLERYNPKSPNFDAEAFLRLAHERGEEPKKAMEDFRDFIHDATRSHKPVLAARPTGFDAMWIHCYFDLLDVDNPFGYGGEDIGSFYRGQQGRLDASINELFTGDGLSHNALEDAIDQAKTFEKMLRK
jgi:ribonuclease T